MKHISGFIPKLGAECRLYLPFNMVGWAFVSVLISIGIWHLTTIKMLTFSRTHLWFLAGFAILLLPFLNPQAEWNIQAQPRFLAIVAGLLLFFSFSQFQFSVKQRHCLLYLIDPIIKEFEKEQGIKVNMVYAEDGLAERLAREGKHPTFRT